MAIYCNRRRFRMPGPSGGGSFYGAKGRRSRTVIPFAANGTRVPESSAQDWQCWIIAPAKIQFGDALSGKYQGGTQLGPVRYRSRPAGVLSLPYQTHILGLQAPELCTAVVRRVPHLTRCN